ncbi:hypothetical protein AUC69_15250 [Methyloceanibacter superfactus]|uniref:Uncharacterized protein n=1 Tax=Methyloceanibacter superfactus TaxID=1774969 RepID=A0A1E3VRG1_9HYPH|nr:hypothetical protein AUC69_15250 [Methyloceanibacter superfactus]
MGWRIEEVPDRRQGLSGFSTMGECPAPSIMTIFAPGTLSKSLALAGEISASSVPNRTRSGGTGSMAASRAGVPCSVT